MGYAEFSAGKFLRAPFSVLRGARRDCAGLNHEEKAGLLMRMSLPLFPFFRKQMLRSAAPSSQSKTSALQNGNPAAAPLELARRSCYPADGAANPAIASG
ncbi:MAG TPA: hypothetical protein VLI91_01275 [Roseiarcus sp.]|nr:hypothetical protein [Roseiarcus sp.]